MSKLFGTDGVRGIANTELTPELAFGLGRAGAYVLTKHNNNKPRIIIGTDGRASGDMLAAALTAGMCSVGAHVSTVGIIPTPAVAHLVRKYSYDAGVVISASHNPAEYNGIKFFNGSGYKLPDILEDEIEEILFDKEKEALLPRPVGGEVGTCDVITEALADYVSFAVSCTQQSFKGIKVVLDCANGASFKAAPLTFKGLGANVDILSDKPNGMNINAGCGSTHLETLMNRVKETGADLGFAFDGDADRCLAVDEKGGIVDGDMLLTICANHMKQNKTLKNDTVVATVMSNLGFFIMGREKGLNIVQTQVGDRYVLEHMLANGYNLGGEQSGHVIFLDHNTTGDGIVTAVKTLSVIMEMGKSLSELASQMTVLPQALINACVPNEKKYGYMDDIEIKKAIDKLEKEYEGEGRVLIRASGTEPLVRVMIEGRDKGEITENAERIARLIEKRLG